MIRFFEIIPGFFAWGTLAGLTFLSWQAPVFVAVFIVLFDLYWLLKTVYLFFHLRIAFGKMQKNMDVNWLERLRKEKNSRWKNIRHLIIVPAYREPYELLFETFLSLSRVRYPKKNLFVVLAIEERGGAEDAFAARRIEEEFSRQFGVFLITRHPAGIPGELPGKGSNQAWAARRVKEIIDRQKIPYRNILVSVFDADTRPERDYFGILTYTYLSTKQPERSSYQPVPLYFNNICEVPFFTRLTALSGSFWQLMQQSRKEQLVTFSSHSMPFSALVEAGFWETNVVSEDSRIFFQLLLKFRGNWRTTPLHYPVYMDAAAGPSFWKSLKTLYLQQRRWAWGVENVSYLLSQLWKMRKVPRWARVWLIRLMAGFYSWSTASFVIFLFGILPNVLGGDAFRTTVLSYNLPRITAWIMNISMLGIITSAFFSVLLLMPIKRAVSKWRYALYFFQWFFMPFIFILFGGLPALDAQTRLLLGGKFRLGFWRTPKAVPPSRDIIRKMSIRYANFAK